MAGANLAKAGAQALAVQHLLTAAEAADHQASCQDEQRAAHQNLSFVWSADDVLVASNSGQMSARASPLPAAAEIGPASGGSSFANVALVAAGVRSPSDRDVPLFVELPTLLRRSALY